MKHDALISHPSEELSDEETNARAELVQDILRRGKYAVFTRPNRITRNPVVKVVTEWKPTIDEATRQYDIEASQSNGSTPSIALWDPSYTITEVEPSILV